MHVSKKSVFNDLGFSKDEAANLEIRARLMRKLREAIKASRLTQKETALLFDVNQPRISNLLNGRIDKFSIDFLVRMLAKIKIPVKIEVVKFKRTTPKIPQAMLKEARAAAR